MTARMDRSGPNAMVTTGGASAYASGSHVCSGQTGILIAKAAVNARNSTVSYGPPSPSGRASSAGRSKVNRPAIRSPANATATRATSISALPAIVYRRNFIAAGARPGPPHSPIRKYIGMSIPSQNT